MLKTTWRTCMVIVLIAGLALMLVPGLIGCGGHDNTAPPPGKDPSGRVWSGPTTCYGGCEAKPAPK